MEKFYEVVEAFEKKNNGRVVFEIMDKFDNSIGFYEEELYNRGDEESINTYNKYCNCMCRVVNIENKLAWTKVTCEVI